ncbi:MAG: nuclear transport factor 2 family protein [Pyrinomonadaceae bacterium]
MKKRLSLVAILALVVIGSCGFYMAADGAVSVHAQQQQDVARQIIARERAAVEAWKRKDKAFYQDFLADDATYFGPMSPYLETEPKTNFIPKFEEMAEMFKYVNFEMYNPRVQTYGDTAILTYNSAVMVNMAGRPMNYTAKISVVYVRQGNSWRVVHGHESMNPGAQ